MRISVDLSLYPLQENYKTPIKAFIAAISACEGLEVQCNKISTQVFGEYDTVMGAIQTCLKETFEKEGTFVLVSKILSVERQ